MESYLGEGLAPLLQELSGLYSLYNGYLPPQLRPYTPFLLGTGALILGGTRQVLGRKKRKRESDEADDASVKRSKATVQVEVPEKDEVKEAPTVGQAKELKQKQEPVKSSSEDASVENLVVLAKCQKEAQQQQKPQVPSSVEPELVAEAHIEQPRQVETKLVVPKVSAESDSDDTTSTCSQDDSESENDVTMTQYMRGVVDSSGSESDWSDDTDDSDTVVANNGAKEDRLPGLKLADSTKNVAVEPPQVYDLTHSDHKDSDKDSVPDEKESASEDKESVPEQADSSDDRVVEEDTSSEAETVAPEADPQCEEEAWKFIMSFVGGQQQGQAGRASTEQSQTSNINASKRVTQMEKTPITPTLTVPETATLPEALKNMFREVLLVNPIGTFRLPIKCDSFLDCRRGKFNFTSDKVQVSLRVSRLENYIGLGQPVQFPGNMDTRDKVGFMFEKAIDMSVAEKASYPLKVSTVLPFEEGRFQRRLSALKVELDVVHRDKLHSSHSIE